MKMKNTLKQLLVPTDVFLKCFLKRYDISFETYEYDFNEYHYHFEKIETRCIHNIDSYPYIYIVVKLYNSFYHQYNILLKHFIIYMKKYGHFENIEYDDIKDIDNCIHILFKDVIFLYFVSFMQYYLL